MKRMLAGLALAASLGAAGSASGQGWPPPLQYGREPGCLIQLYWDADFGGGTQRHTQDQPFIGDVWNDEVSSVRVIAGVWEFYFDANYEGESFRTGPGDYPSVGHHWNDQLSSFRCVRPTRPYG